MGALTQGTTGRWCDGTAKRLVGTVDTLDHALSAQTWEAWQGWGWGKLEASSLCAPPPCGKGRL